MDHREFQVFRQKLGKTQKQLARLLGTSLKAIQSFEQGWRRIPAHVERQTLFLLAMKMGSRKQASPCWEIRRCSREMLKNCPAWEFKSGHLCWFINGTICQGNLRGAGVKKWCYAENVRSSLL